MSLTNSMQNIAKKYFKLSNSLIVLKLWHTSSVIRCWNKSSPIFPKVAQIIVYRRCYFKRNVFENGAKVIQYLGNFARKFFTQKSQKTPNRVTLHTIEPLFTFQFSIAACYTLVIAMYT